MIGKYCVIGAIVLALLTFLLPLDFLKFDGPSVSGSGETTYSFTVMSVLGGAESMRDAMAETAPELKAVSAEAFSDDDALNDMKLLVLIPFGPMGFLLLAGLLGIKRFGRGLGVMSLIFGLIGVALWAVFMAAAAEGDGKASFDTMGFNVLGFGYLLGLLGGIMGIAKPQPKST